MRLRALLVALLALFASAASASPRRRRSTSSRRHPSRVEERRPSRASPRRRPAPRPSRARPSRPRPVAMLPALPSPPRPAVGTASAGCGAAGVRPGVSERTITVNGVERGYLLSVPEGYDPRAPRPLVFAFHGLTGTPAGLRSYLRLERAAAGGALFVYPAGLRVNDRTRWDVRASGGDVAFFDALLAHLAASHCVDTGRVFAVGHSAGAVMTNAVGCARGHALRAIAPIAGTGPSARQCADAPSVWITHGRADAPVGFHYGEDTRDRWASAARCEPAPAVSGEPPCARYERCEGGRTVVFCAHDGDHSVPPFAPREIWAFFQRWAPAAR